MSLETKIWESRDDWSEIRYRVRDPKDFDDKSFRRIPYQKKKPKVYAVVGKLKDGDGSMVVQALRFPKAEGWTLEKAKDWVKEHFKKDTTFTELEAESPREFKECQFEIKDLTEAGEFTGLASVFNNVDAGGDVVHRGAFAKSIAELGGRVPLMRMHRVPVGIAYVEETNEGLLVKRGVLNLGKQEARDTYSDLKFYQTHNMPMGMSIGYLSIPSRTEWKGDIRHLLEVKLFETTVTEFPMNEKARVLDVKEGIAMTSENKSAFADALVRRQIYQKQDQMMGSLCASLDSCLYSQMADDEMMSESEMCIDEFKSEYMGWLPQLLALRAEHKDDFGRELKDARETATGEIKAGRRMSAESMQHARRAHDAMASMASMLEKQMDSGEPMDSDQMAAMMGHCTRAQKSLEALLGDDAGGADDGKKSSSGATATSAPGAATPSDAPDSIHPLLSIKNQIQGVFASWHTTQ